jgi:hypothetical protein
MIAFGDDVNDLSLLTTVGTGVAMGNSIEILKRMAPYTTKSNDQDGIANWLIKHLFK